MQGNMKERTVKMDKKCRFFGERVKRRGRKERCIDCPTCIYKGTKECDKAKEDKQ